MTAFYLLLMAACGPKKGLDRGLSAAAPEHVEVDLLRPYPGAPKIYVQATLPDGELGLFLVDTGAGVTAITQDLADRLGIQAQDRGGRVQGLSGEAVWMQAELASLDIGGLLVRDIDIAVGIPGMPTQTRGLKVDGIIGNNVWGRYTLAVDYPADVLELGVPGSVEVPRHAQPMIYDKGHVYVQVGLKAGEEDSRESVERELLLQVDTGAGIILLSGSMGEGFEDVATEGEEPIFGLGASDRMPVSSFYRETRRVPLKTATLGGVTLKDTGPATWLNYQEISPTGMVGLAGHQLLSEHRVVFDYAGGRFALGESTHPARELDGHQIFLDQDIARYGQDALERGLMRARYLLYLQRDEPALDALLAYIESLDKVDPEAQVLLARFHRLDADPQGYEQALAPLNAGDLVDEGELGARVNSLVLLGRAQDALSLAEQAVEERPEEPAALRALSDALMAVGELGRARGVLADAARLAGNPDAYLKRRARMAMRDGDPAASLSYLRQQLAYYPSDGEALWFYAILVSSGEVSGMGQTFDQDRERAMGRLHPESRPSDFLAASYMLTQRADLARDLMAEPMTRCSELEQLPSEQNCMAWTQALSGQASAESLEMIQAALAETGPRSDFLDTQAVVHLMLGEYEQAALAAQQAAMLSPDRFYMLWQAERMEALAQTQRESASPESEE